MSRPTKQQATMNMSFGSLRDYWRAIKRDIRQHDQWTRAKRKAADKKRRKCRCPAYGFPHRPGGGLCRWPDPPLEQWQAKPGGRPYRKRYVGILRQIARANGLHPIRDRKAIDSLMPQVLALARQMKQQCSKLKYRNMEITDEGIRGNYQSAGPMM